MSSLSVSWLSYRVGYADSFFHHIRDTAIEFNEKALAIQVEIGDKVGEAACYANLSLAYHDLGDYEKAIRYNREAYAIQSSIGYKPGQAICSHNLGNIYRDTKEPRKAIEMYLDAEEIFKGAGQTQYLQITYDVLSLTYEDIGDYENAKKYRGLLTPSK